MNYHDHLSVPPPPMDRFAAASQRAQWSFLVRQQSARDHDRTPEFVPPELIDNERGEEDSAPP